MRLAMLGFGLIGGSVARALREREPGRWSLTAWTPTGHGPRRAVAEGTLARAAESVETAVEGADIVMLAAPPLACLDLLDQLAAAGLPAGVVVTDVASTKRAVVGRAAAAGLTFVGGHPMAGRDTVGYGAAEADLFVDRPWVICPAGAGVDRVEAVVVAVGARPVEMTAEAHDAAVAAISHLPLVLAAALVESVAGSAAGDWPAIRDLAAGGWRDMTRLARGDVEMGAGIAVTNADLVAGRLRDLRAVLDGWLADLEAGEPEVDRLRDRFAAARRRLEDGT
jgi:prephenate dehydrogenase